MINQKHWQKRLLVDINIKINVKIILSLFTDFGISVCIVNPTFTFYQCLGFDLGLKKELETSICLIFSYLLFFFFKILIQIMCIKEVLEVLNCFKQETAEVTGICGQY